MRIDLNIIREKLSSSVISDVLDGMGYPNQAMSKEIRPLDPGMKIVGYAATMLMADIYDQSKDTFGLQMKTIDDLKPDEVMMICANGSERAALWGELLSTAAKYRGAVGAILDGLVRDVNLIQDMKYPVFAKGICPVSSKGRLIAIEQSCPILVGGVKVKPGDLVVADLDGVAVIPTEIAEAVIEEALDVTNRETMTRDELKKGSTLTEVFEKYGTI